MLSRPASRLTLASLMLALAALPALACETGVAKLRFQDDYSCFKDPANRDGLLDQLKFIPLGDAGTISLSLGGEIRQRYEYTQNPAFGADPQDENGVWMQRLTLHGDLRLGEHLRIFGQAYSALEAGRAGGPSPVDENRFEFQNAFVEASFSPFAETTLGARVGRQEMAFGSERLVSVREGPNNRRNFDAARVTFTLPDWQIDAIAARPVVPSEGVFDDQTSDEQWFWGLYATGGREVLPFGALDLYYLGFRDDSGGFVEGTARELRHTLGLRFFGRRGIWDWNWEAAGQFGSFGDGRIRAWTLASDTGVTLEDLPFAPRFGLLLDIASGDDTPGDGDLGTFNPLFPRGNYFSEAAVLGPRNFFNVNPTLELTPAEDWSAAMGANFFWRLKTGDGVYTPSGQILRAPNGSDERFVGTGLSFSLSHEIAPNLVATGIYTRLFAGSFLRETGPGEDIDFFEATLQYKF